MGKNLPLQHSMLFSNTLVASKKHHTNENNIKEIISITLFKLCFYSYNEYIKKYTTPEPSGINTQRIILHSASRIKKDNPKIRKNHRLHHHSKHGHHNILWFLFNGIYSTLSSWAWTRFQRSHEHFQPRSLLFCNVQCIPKPYVQLGGCRPWCKRFLSMQKRTP